MLETPWSLTGTAVPNNGDFNLGFTYFDTDVTDAANGKFKAYKLQEWPAASWADAFRFEKGKLAVGYVRDQGKSTRRASFKDETKVLANAISVASSLAGLSALLATVTLF